MILNIIDSSSTKTKTIKLITQTSFIGKKRMQRTTAFFLFNLSLFILFVLNGNTIKNNCDAHPNAWVASATKDITILFSRGDSFQRGIFHCVFPFLLLMRRLSDTYWGRLTHGVEPKVEWSTRLIVAKGVFLFLRSFSRIPCSTWSLEPNSLLLLGVFSSQFPCSFPESFFCIFTSQRESRIPYSLRSIFILFTSHMNKPNPLFIFF